MKGDKCPGSRLNLLSPLPSDDARPVASSGGSSRRKRTSFSKEHVELLRTTFETDPYPGISLRESLSQATGLPESRIQVRSPPGYLTQRVPDSEDQVVRVSETPLR